MTHAGALQGFQDSSCSSFSKKRMVLAQASLESHDGNKADGGQAGHKGSGRARVVAEEEAGVEVLHSLGAGGDGGLIIGDGGGSSHRGGLERGKGLRHGGSRLLAGDGGTEGRVGEELLGEALGGGNSHCCSQANCKGRTGQEGSRERRRGGAARNIPRARRRASTKRRFILVGVEQKQKADKEARAFGRLLASRPPQAVARQHPAL